MNETVRFTRGSSRHPYFFMDNAFWENEEKTVVKCIRVTKLPDGKEKKDILSVPQFKRDGSLNPMWEEVMQKLTVEGINRTHAERVQRKEAEQAQATVIDSQNRKAAQLEDLFSLKLKAFEIDVIKLSTNRQLRSRLRRAQNEIELNAIATLIIGEELGYFTKARDEDE